VGLIFANWQKTMGKLITVYEIVKINSLKLVQFLVNFNDFSIRQLRIIIGDA
jgi:hypothetical protein